MTDKTDNTDKKIKKTSEKTYADCVERLIKKKLNIENPQEIEKYFDESNFSKSYIRLNYISLFRHFSNRKEQIAKKYRDLAFMIDKDVKESQSKQLLTDKEKTKYVDYDIIQKSWLEAKNNSHLNLEEKILYGLLTQLPPVRLDYNNIQFFDKLNKKPTDFSGNYIEIINSKNAKIVIQEHKTSKSRGTLTREINGDTGIMPYLILWRKGNPDKTSIFNYKRNTFGKKIASIFNIVLKKPITINILRHAYVSSIRGNDVPNSVKEELARTLGHSVKTDDNYIRYV